jgi:FMN-dependent NADH-azoreductase
MSHLLHLDSSLRTEGSRSRKLSAYYAEHWRARHPGGTVTYRDLAVDPIPHLDHTAFSARFTAPADHTPEQAAASALTEKLVDEVLAADTILIAVQLRPAQHVQGLVRPDRLGTDQRKARRQGVRDRDGTRRRLPAGHSP